MSYTEEELATLSKIDGVKIVVGEPVRYVCTREHGEHYDFMTDEEVKQILLIEAQKAEIERLEAINKIYLHDIDSFKNIAACSGGSFSIAEYEACLESRLQNLKEAKQ